MNQSALFQKLIDHSQRNEEIEPSQKAEIRSCLEYFKLQFLCDLDRRDKPEVLKKEWVNFLKLIKGSKLLKELQSDRYFWISIEDAVGIARPIEPIKEAEMER